MKKIMIFLLCIIFLPTIWECATNWEKVSTEVKEEINKENSIKSKEENKPVSVNNNRVFKESFFGNLKPDSSILDVINTLKKYDSVTSIEFGYRDPVFRPIKKYGEPINFKNSNLDRKTLLDYLEKFPQKHETIYQKNATKGKIYSTDLSNTFPCIVVKTIYVENIPFEFFEINFKSAPGFYALYQEEVMKSNKTGIAYPLLIDYIDMSAYSNNDLTKKLIEQNTNNLIQKYKNKYPDLKEIYEVYDYEFNHGYSYCSHNKYHGDYCNKFLTIEKGPDPLRIIYNNETFLEELEKKYTELRLKASIQENQKFNSSDI